MSLSLFLELSAALKLLTFSSTSCTSAIARPVFSYPYLFHLCKQKQEAGFLGERMCHIRFRCVSCLTFPKVFCWCQSDYKQALLLLTWGGKELTPLNILASKEKKEKEKKLKRPIPASAWCAVAAASTERTANVAIPLKYQNDSLKEAVRATERLTQTTLLLAACCLTQRFLFAATGGTRRRLWDEKASFSQTIAKCISASCHWQLRPHGCPLPALLNAQNQSFLLNICSCIHHFLLYSLLLLCRTF